MTATDTARADAPVELFGHVWDPADNPAGHAAAVAWRAAHALDVDEVDR